MKNRIMFITGSLELGGIERLISELSIALKDSGDWEPLICCLIEKKGEFLVDLGLAGIPVFECPLDKQSLLTFPYRLSKLVRNTKPDIVHSHVDSSIPWQVLGIRLGGVRNIVWTQHSEYPNWDKSIFARFRIWLYYKVAWSSISAYTAVSMGVQKSVSNLSGQPLSDFQVIYNPVDAAVFKPSLEKRSTAREAFGATDDHFVIGNVARFAEPKGHIYLVKAAKIITILVPNSRFILVGDGPLRQTIEAVVKKEGLDKYFIFMGKRRDVHEILPGFDMFIFPSLWEGLGIVLLEAMACGLPVVASKVGGIPEALGEIGLTTPPGDHQALAKAVIKLYNNPGLRTDMGDAARKRVIKNFSIEKILNQYIQLYKNNLS